MIAKIIVAFCVFQVTFGQDDPEAAIQNFISKINTESNDIINPLVTRLVAFGNSFAASDQDLNNEYTALRQQLQILASQANGTNNPTICLNLALEDAYNLYQTRASDVTAFHQVHYNDLNQIFDELDLVNQEQQIFVSEIENSIQGCNSVSILAEAQECLQTVYAPLDEMATDIFNRFEEIRQVAEDLLTTAEDEMQNLDDENTAFVSQAADQTKQELINCISGA